MSRRIETDKDSVPDGYYIESHGATYTIYKSDTDNPVSLSYHEIDFPKVKIGAHITTLIEKMVILYLENFDQLLINIRVNQIFKKRS